MSASIHTMNTHGGGALSRWAFALLLVALLGCGDERGKGKQGQEEEGGEQPTSACEVSEELLAARRVCLADDECPCGTHCEFGVCVASCRSDDDCGEGQVCDRFGECRSAAEEAIGKTRAQKSAAEGLKFTTPRIKLESAVSTVHVVSKERAQVRVVGTKKLEVRCHEDADFADECMAESSSEGAAIEVRRKPNAKAAGDDDSDGPQVLKVFPQYGGARLLSVQLSEDEPVPPFSAFSQGGQYAGTATFAAAGGASAEVLSGAGLGLWISLDLYPGASEQVIRLRDPSGVIAPSGELIGTVNHAADGSQKFSFPSYLYLSRGTSGAEAIEVVASPSVTGSITDTTTSLSLQLTLSGLTNQEQPKQRWELRLSRVGERPAELEAPSVPPSRGVQLAQSRADQMFSLEAQWADAPSVDAEDGAELAAIKALCGGAASGLSSEPRSPLSGDWACEGVGGRFFTLPYLDDQSRTREALLARCGEDLSRAAAGNPPLAGSVQDPVCIHVGQALWAATAAAQVPGSPMHVSDDDPAHAPAYALSMRVLTQLFGLGQFVAIQSREYLRFHARAEAVRSTSDNPYDVFLQDALDKLEASWTPFWWLLTPRLGNLLSTVPSDLLYNPSYDDQPNEALEVPLPTVLVEALAEQVALMADVVEAAHFGGRPAPEQIPLALRRVLAVRTLAHALWAKAKTHAETQPLSPGYLNAMDERFRAASRALDAAWESVIAAEHAIAAGRNPLGIEDADIPLYRADGEASTPRMQAFASSAYLTDLAERATADAENAWASAEGEDQALRARSLELQIALQESAQRGSAIRTTHSERLAALCGFDVSTAERMLSDPSFDASKCFVADGCDFTPPNPVGPPEVFFETCRLTYLRPFDASQGFFLDDRARAKALHDFFDDTARNHGATSLQVESAGSDFRISVPGGESILVTRDELSQLIVEPKAAAPVPLPTTPANGIEAFTPVQLDALNKMKPFGDADSLCAQARDRRYGGGSGSRTLPAALDNAACYRGTIGEAALATRRASVAIEAAKARLDEFMQAYEIAVQQCAFDDAAGNLLAESEAKFEADTKDLRGAVQAMSIISSICTGVGAGAEIGGAFSGKKTKKKQDASQASGTTQSTASGSTGGSGSGGTGSGSGGTGSGSGGTGSGGMGGTGSGSMGGTGSGSMGGTGSGSMGGTGSGQGQTAAAGNDDTVPSKVESVASGMGNLASLAGSIMQGVIDEHQAKHEARVADIRDDATKRKCMNNAQLSLVGMDNARIEITAAMQELGLSLLRLENLQREALNVVEGAALAQANETRVGLSQVVGRPWLSRVHADLERRMRFARRITYLVVRAAEWESQQTLGASRVAVLSALTPADLKRELDAMVASLATRSVPGASTVGAQYAVISVKEQLLRKLAVSSDDPTEQLLSAEDALRRELMSPKYAVFDDTRYLGQRIPLELAVSGDTEGSGARFEGFPPNLCAERLWTVVVGIDGEPGVSGDSSLTRVELLKHNTFASRVCGGGDLQSATVAPGRNLFLDPKYQSALAEIFDRPSADAYSRAAFGAVRTNVTREAFEEQAYDQGAQTGFAGRGLFGQYALFFPAESLRHEVCGEDGCSTHNETGLDLSRVNDVLLRFEYVAWSSAN